MASYLADGDVTALIHRARSVPPEFLETLGAIADLGRGVEALGVEVLSLRQRVQADALNLERYGRTVAAKDTELRVAYAKLAALEQRLAALAAA